eukprot:224833-Rhodomonas_salina.1
MQAGDDADADGLLHPAVGHARQVGARVEQGCDRAPRAAALRQHGPARQGRVRRPGPEARTAPPRPPLQVPHPLHSPHAARALLAAFHNTAPRSPRPPGSTPFDALADSRAMSGPDVEATPAGSFLLSLLKAIQRDLSLRAAGCAQRLAGSILALAFASRTCRARSGSDVPCSAGRQAARRSGRGGGAERSAHAGSE